jgi:hypothetical protein
MVLFYKNLENNQPDARYPVFVKNLKTHEGTEQGQGGEVMIIDEKKS